MQMSRNMNCIPSGQDAVNLSSIQCRSFLMPCARICADIASQHHATSAKRVWSLQSLKTPSAQQDAQCALCARYSDGDDDAHIVPDLVRLDDQK